MWLRRLVHGPRQQSCQALRSMVNVRSPFEVTGLSRRSLTIHSITPVPTLLSKRALKTTLQQMHALRSDAAARQSEQRMLIFGRKMIDEHMKRGGVVLQLYLTPECQVEADPSIPTQLLDHTDLRRVSGVESTPADGCAAVVPLPPTSIPEPAFVSGQRTLVLDRVSDPGNVGALFRSARAFDFGVVALLGGCDPFNEKVIRSSMGAALQLRLWQVEEADFLREVHQAGASIAVCDASANGSVALPEWSTTASTPLCLVVGNEAHGVRASLRAVANTRLHIPMNPEVESLNAAVAGSILMHHVHAQMPT